MFTYIFILTLFLVGCEQSEPLEKEFQLVWEDNFNDVEIDESKWEFQLGDGSQYGLWGWGNDEKQWYTKDNASVSNGNLLIKAVKEQNNGYEYTSSRLRTLNKFDFKYGRVEASIRMSDVAGLWHALWMLPTNANNWPSSGEIDIMEYVGQTPTEIFTYLHLGDAVGNQISIGQATAVENISSQFHNYGLEWDENKIVWFIDSVEVHKVIKSDNRITGEWPFDAEFHLILNTAVGGNLGGDIDDTRLNNPKYMEVEYIKVYQGTENK